MKLKILALAVLAILLVPQIASSGLQEITYSSYEPAFFRISFPQTNNVNVTVLPEAGGLYTYSVTTSSPNSTIVIDLNSSDIYNVAVFLQYPFPISGTVQWTLNSGGSLPSGGEDSFTNQSSFLISFSFELLPFQRVPTSDEIANATAALLVNLLNQANLQLKQSYDASIANMQLEVDVAFAILGIAVVVMTLLSVMVFKKMRSD